LCNGYANEGYYDTFALRDIEGQESIQRFTSLAHKWGVIILIDEADVYLAERSLQDVQRNGLVSVFLRHLEYFQGIMFLTTNRLTTFDDAFQSRIHFAMKFSDLTIKVKKAIWEIFL
jgi:ATPase family associated with various cellular activities (AAA)